MSAFSGLKENRFLVPGEFEISVEARDKYVLWSYETTLYRGRTYVNSDTLPNGMSVSIIELKSGKEIPVADDLGATFSSGAEKSFSVVSFYAYPGRYRIKVSGDFSDRVFSVRRSIWSTLKGTLDTLIIGFVLIVIGWIGGSGIAIFIYIRRSEHKRLSKKNI